MENYKRYAMLMCSAGLMCLVIGITYAFFNYTKTGNNNLLSVGRISFASSNEQTITLNNLFPIDPTESGIMNDSTKVGTYQISITGDTDYSDGIEYLVSIVDANIYTSTGKTIPISLDISTNGLGNENNNYFSAREAKNTTMYTKVMNSTLEGNGMLLVGYIKPNTTTGTAEGVNGSITIKAYLDKNNIAVSDTYDGSESFNNGTTSNWVNGRTVLTTSEWDAISNTGVSFKVKVEANKGIWVIGSLEGLMRKDAVMDNISSLTVSTSSGIDFSKNSSDTNGKGLFIKNETVSDSNPIVYYRGEVDNNNVIFANKCWKALRTTDTGGVKLIYNGEVKELKRGLAEEDYHIITNTSNIYQYDTDTTRWVGDITSDNTYDFEFTVSEAASDYVLDLEFRSYYYSGGTLSVYKNNSLIYSNSEYYGDLNDYKYEVGSLTTTDKIKIRYVSSGASASSPISYIFQMYKNSGYVMNNICDNNSKNTQISVNNNNVITNKFKFNTKAGSYGYQLYMYGDEYLANYSGWTTNALFGSGFTYNNGVYTLTDATVTTPNATHHYSCNATTADATCESIRYVHYSSGNTKYYLTLTDGDGIEQAIEKMRAQTNDSLAKETVETWYANNLTSYNEKIEDTIYCSDSSIYQLGGMSSTGSLSSQLYTNADNRVSNTYVPITTCPNRRDAYTWKNSQGNGKSSYPIGLITSDELMMAGIAESSILNDTFTEKNFLRTGMEYWSMTPAAYVGTMSLVFYGTNTGFLSSNSASQEAGIRPVIAIKPGQAITKGNGIVTNPYVIE